MTSFEHLIESTDSAVEKRPWTSRWWIVLLIALVPMPPTWIWAAYLWARRLSWPGRLLALVSYVAIMGVVVIGVYASMPTLEEQIARQNASVGGTSSGGSSFFGSIFGKSVLDLRQGDCFNASIPDVGYTEFDWITTVSCSGDWEFRVSRQVLLDHPTDVVWPGEGTFEGLFERDCGTSDTSFFFPTQETWDLGDRVLTCLAER